MTSYYLLYPLIFIVVFVGQTSASANWTWDTVTYLDNFVNRIDPEFDPNVDEILYFNNTELGCHTYIVNFTSGRWLDESFSNRPIWWHYLAVNIPLDDNIQVLDSGILFIEGDGNGGPPDQDDTFINALCLTTRNTGAVSAVLKQIPNRNTLFVDDPDQIERGEDDIIAYTWQEFIFQHDNVEDYVERDYEMLIDFPMARGGVRAMDVMNVFAKKKIPQSDLIHFTVSGGSKRGIAAWQVGAVDPRVDILAPLVSSIQNTVQNLHHTYENLGAWSFALSSYWEMNITMYLDDPRTQLMMDQIDGYCYRNRLTMVKLIGCATGDEFFSLDDTHDFYSDLPDPKYMLMMENAEHTLIGSYTRTLNALTQVFKGVRTVGPENMPTMWWEMEEDSNGGSIHVHTDTVPAVVKAFHGDSVPETRRDFRIIALDGLQLVYWNETEDASWTVHDDYNFSVHYNRSDDTPYRAFLVNVLFNGTGSLYDFTTEANVIPWTRPFPPCEGFECKAGLI